MRRINPPDLPKLSVNREGCILENVAIEKEKEALKTLMTVEDLVEKKAKIHSRLLMDAALAKDMEELSLRHEKRKETLSALALGKAPKRKTDRACLR